MTTDRLFSPPPEVPAPPPSYRAPSRTAARAADHAILIAAGVHPLIRGPLGPPGETCGSCAHSIRFARFAKCGLNDTRSHASDIRLFWPACPGWKPPKV